MKINRPLKNVCLLLLIASAWCCAEETNTPFPQNAQEGAIAYAKYCALCHGPNGEGYTADSATALNNASFLATATDTFLYNAIAEGRMGTTMSPWADYRGGPLEEQDIWNLVGLLRSWQTIPTIDVSDAKIKGVALRGEPVYAVYCASCHGPKGEGASYMSLNNPQFLSDASDGFIRFAIVNGRPETSMSAYQSILSTQDIHDVVALIRSWARPAVAGPLLFPDGNLGDPVLNPDGEEPSFLTDELYLPLDTLTEAVQTSQRLIILDARPPADYVQSHITGAVSVPFYDVESYLDQLPKDTWIVAYCGCPHAESTAAAEALQANGYDKVMVLDEGFEAWVEAGLPTSSGPNP